MVDMKWQMSRFAFMSNPYRLLKQLAVLTGFWMVACSSVQAQQSYYIYIQSENGQPFYTQIGDKVYSSSAIGHLIISGLKDNVCTFEIGFPQHTSRPQQFSVPIKGKDHGFQLKKSGTDWSLVSWQNQETIKPLRGSGNSAVLYGERKKDDAFATLMAAVVNDSAVLYTSIVKNDVTETPVVAKAPEAKKEEVKEEKQTDVAVTPPVTTVAAVTPPLDSAKTYKNEKPLYDTTTAVVKEYRNDKPLFDTTKAVVKPYKNEKPLYDTTAAVVKEYKNDKPLYDTTAGISNKPLDGTNAKDTLFFAKVPVKETKAEAKQASPGVVKVQETTDKDGQKKLVFIDSSESPATVVTVYIAEEKAPVQQKTPEQTVSTEVATNTTPKTNEEPKPEKKPDTGNKKMDSIVKDETAKNEPANTKKETVKEGANTTTPAAAVQATRTDAIIPVTEKPAGKKGDTLTIILESPQMRRDTSRTVKQEAPKPLYEPKQVTEPVAKQNDADKAGITATTGAVTTTQGTPITTKQDIPVTTKQDAPVTSKPADKPVNMDNQAAQRESAKPATDTEKKVTEPVITQKDTAVAKQEAPKALYNPKPAETEKKKVVMINSDCARFASDNDVDKLRVKMLAGNDMQKRVAIANKVFKSMCLYARQMRALSELFPTDETKYKFLEMAYPFAADTGEFKELYALFSTESYQTKFKTLVRY